MFYFDILWLYSGLQKCCFLQCRSLALFGQECNLCGHLSQALHQQTMGMGRVGGRRGCPNQPPPAPSQLGPKTAPVSAFFPKTNQAPSLQSGRLRARTSKTSILTPCDKSFISILRQTLQNLVFDLSISKNHVTFSSFWRAARGEILAADSQTVPPNEFLVDLEGHFVFFCCFGPQ